jgi:peroxiredoxin
MISFFSARSSNANQFHFDKTAGRYVVLCFYGSAAIAKNARILEDFTNRFRSFFDDQQITFFGVSVDRQDKQLVVECLNDAHV